MKISFPRQSYKTILLLHSYLFWKSIKINYTIVQWPTYPYFPVFFLFWTHIHTHSLSLLLPSTPLIFPLEMNLPLIQGYATFKSLNQKLSNSPLSMLIPSSFQQLMSSCLKDPLILHKCPPSAKQTSLGNSCKQENVCLLPVSRPFFPTLPLHSLWGPSCLLLPSTHSLEWCSQTSTAWPTSPKHLRDIRSFLPPSVSATHYLLSVFLTCKTPSQPSEEQVNNEWHHLSSNFNLRVFPSDSTAFCSLSSFPYCHLLNFYPSSRLLKYHVHLEAVYEWSRQSFSFLTPVSTNEHLPTLLCNTISQSFPWGWSISLNKHDSSVISSSIFYV